DGRLIVGVNPNRALDEGYRDFCALLAGQVSAALRSAQSYDEERQRAAALAELDRAKTEFFSNVSHEFRTPLTLMLGPLEETLRGRSGALPADAVEDLDLVHRNALRLLRLANSLLDFARFEKDRLQARYEPVDLAALTADLASVFRAAIEKAGLDLRVHCPPLPEPAYIDPAMWEKIVLNLISNAFKFTRQGSIRIAQEVAGDEIRLIVADSGCGIPPADLAHVFTRFYRVEGTAGRTYEGSGIGLALVQELVRLHGGRIEVESAPGRGSAFTVSIPRSAGRWPAERIGAAGRWPARRVRARKQRPTAGAR
ncbi:MAG TPA: HAMP domain-containing sensor histidine kinase, partial [Herpetosiphonaceae bacterium]|nr:HAMP domain-containing sensor histidine kinase [Herpetosiphonaceae bacterium]